MIKFLSTINPYDGCYLQCNEYLFEAVQGFWILRSISNKKLAFIIDA